VKDVLDFLGGKLFDAEFCNDHSGSENMCTHSVDCSIRSLWQMLQSAVDGVLKDMTIKDLVSKEEMSVTQITSIGIPAAIKI
jgi:Rrf2 family iron-sulfur cluster assembly transcriptional regulator